MVLKYLIEETELIPNFIGYLVIYFCFATILRYLDEDFRVKYKRYYQHYLKESNLINVEVNQKVNDKLQSKFKRNRIVRKGVLFIDIIFPVIFGLFSIYIIYFS